MGDFFTLFIAATLLAFGPIPIQKCKVDNHGKTLQSLGLKGDVKQCTTISLANYNSPPTTCDTLSRSSYLFDDVGRMAHYSRHQKKDREQTTHCIWDSVEEHYTYYDARCSVRRVLGYGEEKFGTLFVYETHGDSVLEYSYKDAAKTPDEITITVYGRRQRPTEEYLYHGSLLSRHTIFRPGHEESRRISYNGHTVKGWSYEQCDTVNNTVTHTRTDSNATTSGLSAQKTVTLLDGNGQKLREASI